MSLKTAWLICDVKTGRSAAFAEWGNVTSSFDHKSHNGTPPAFAEQPFPYNLCMGQCIYCRKPLTGSEPLEHVIPQGCFGEFNLTLSCVCEQCNHFFGRTLEWPMRNSSTEGVVRFVHGLGSGQVGNIGTKGIEIKLEEPPEWRGARVVLKADEQQHAFVDLLPQIAARSNVNEAWTWYLEKDIDAEFAKKYPTGSEFRIVAPAPDHERLTNRLIEVCPSFKKGGDLASPVATDGTVGAAWITEFTQAVRRLLAKIAFNYLAYMKGPDFVLSSEFDIVRSFVLDGVEPASEVVRVTANRAEEKFEPVTGTEDHLIILQAMPEKRCMEVHLRLFGTSRYRIALSREYNGASFLNGHRLVLANRDVHELTIRAEIEKAKHG